MSILIRGMEMPKEDTKVLMIFPDGNVRIWGTDIDADKWAEAIEVPTPHGDLIDRDAIPWRNLNHPTAEKWVDELHVRIMPAAIEAEGET